MEFNEMSVIFRFGAALITADEGRTAICRPTVTEKHLDFEVIRWCDTYDEALTYVAVWADMDAESFTP